MNSDGTIKSQTHQQSVVKEDFRHNGDNRKKRKNIHEFNLFKRYPKCDCTNCWKNFVLTIIFYAIVIYILYLIVKFIFSLTDEKQKTLTNTELPTSL
jgi:hypothetical protein